MTKSIKVYKSFYPSDVIKYAGSNNEKELILYEWFCHFNEYFTPVAQEHVPFLLDNISDSEKKLEIIKSAFWHNPVLFHSEIAKNKDYRLSLYGKRINVIPKDCQHDIMIYSKKLNSNYVSSQELIRPVIEHLCKKFNTVLVSPENSPPDEYYKNLVTNTVLIDPNNDPKIINKQLEKQAARIIINLDSTDDNEWLLTMKNSYLISIWGSEPGGARIPDGIVLCKSIPNSYIDGLFDSSRRLSWVSCTNPAPIQTQKRKYNRTFTNKNVLGKSDAILFGAFCRLTKINTNTLKVWAYALRYFENSKLGFSYIQVNSISEYYVKKFFKKEGINPERVFFYSRSDTNTYLERMNQIDIMFGASPEEGGVTFTDSLCQGVPFITYNAESSSTTSTNALTEMGYPEWCVRSPSDFVKVITKELRSSHKRSGIRQSEIQQKMLSRSVDVRQKYIGAIDSMIEEYLK